VIAGRAGIRSTTIEFGSWVAICACCDRGDRGDVHEYGVDVPPHTNLRSLFRRPQPAITVTMLADADRG
jgi:hypothetical protein